jgi:MOB kinase activator 1
MGVCGAKPEQKQADAAPAKAQPAPQQPGQAAVTKASEAQQKAPAPAAGAGGGEDKEANDEGDEVAAGGGGGPEDFKGADSADASAGGDAYNFWERNRTFKPAKEVGKKGEKLHNTIKATMKATLGGGELRKTVKLPDGEDKNEWIAVNTVHFYNAANMIYGTCAEFCTDETCKSMSAGRNEYLWKDGDKYKKPTRVSAPIYIDLLLNWVNEQISNPNIFPVDETGKFPRNFMSVVKNIYKRLFRLYAHIYYSHFEKIRDIGANAHLNTCFKHFIFFILEFDLVDAKSMAPLDNFINKFKDQE